MKEQLFDFTVMGLVSIFAIDMAAERLYAAAPKPYDELEAFIQQSEKTMQKSATMVKAAAEKQAVVEQEIVENVEQLEETIVETQAAADSISVAFNDTKEEMDIMKEVTAEVTAQMKQDPEFAQKVLVSGFDAVIETRTKVKVMDKKIEKAAANGNDSVLNELLYMKNFYKINGVDVE